MPGEFHVLLRLPVAARSIFIDTDSYVAGEKCADSSVALLNQMLCS